MSQFKNITEFNPKSWLRILAVFAHPDDEIFCAGGVLARYVAEGAEAMVVSATQGEAGQIRDARVATRRTLGSVRAQELLLSCERLGVQHALCLDYGDGALRDGDPKPLTEHLTQIIRAFRPDVVITFGPDGAYGHPDHVTIGELTSQAFYLAGDATQFPDQLATGLSPYTPGRLYYSYFPRRRRLLAHQLVRWLVDSEKSFNGTIDFAHALLLFAEGATMLGYTSDHVEVKWFPNGFYIVEQEEPATQLYLILSGQAEVIQEAADGTLHTLMKLGPGQFFGEQEIASQQPHQAHVVACENVTCMVLSPNVQANFAGRGPEAILTDTTILSGSPLDKEFDTSATTKIDVSDYVEQKVAALAAHRTQYPLEPDMFPMSMLREMFSYEYFVRIYPSFEMENSLFSIAELLHSRLV